MSLNIFHLQFLDCTPVSTIQSSYNVDFLCRLWIFPLSSLLTAERVLNDISPMIEVMNTNLGIFAIIDCICMFMKVLVGVSFCFKN